MCAQRPEVDLDDHVVAHLLVEGEHPRVVGVVAVDHGMQLEALDARLPHPPHLGGLVLQVGVHGAEGNQHIVLDAYEPVVGARQVLQPLDHAQHNYGFVHARRPHVRLDAVHGVDAHGGVAEGVGHVLQDRRGDAVGPDVGMNVNAHLQVPHSLLPANSPNSTPDAAENPCQRCSMEDLVNNPSPFFPLSRQHRVGINRQPDGQKQGHYGDEHTKGD